MMKTWGDLLKALMNAGFADDEYLCPACEYKWPDWETMPLHTEDTFIVCFWKTSEYGAWYTHIARQSYVGTGKKTTIQSESWIVGKFHTWERAEQCALAAQRLVNL